MAFSSFRINYQWGQCIITPDELRFWNPIVVDIGGGSQPMEDLTNDELQEGVLTLLESGPGKLTDLKNGDPRCTFVEDVSGWPT